MSLWVVKVCVCEEAGKRRDHPTRWGGLRVLYQATPRTPYPTTLKITRTMSVYVIWRRVKQGKMQMDT